MCLFKKQELYFSFNTCQRERRYVKWVILPMLLFHEFQKGLKILFDNDRKRRSCINKIFRELILKVSISSEME